MKPNKLEVTDVKLFVYTNENNHLTWLTDYIINDMFIIQYDSVTSMFTMPAGDQMCWKDKDVQDFAHEVIDPANLSCELELPEDLHTLWRVYHVDIHGDQESIELFTTQVANKYFSINNG